MGVVASCGGCGGGGEGGARPPPARSSGGSFEPLAEGLRRRVRDDGWAEVIAHFMSRVRLLLARRFRRYLGQGAGADADASEDARDEARNQALFAAVFHRYDEAGRGRLSRSEFQRAVLDLVMQQRKLVPPLLDAVRDELVGHARGAMDRVREEAGVGDEFVASLVPCIEDAVAAEAEELEFLMDSVVRDHAAVSDAVWRTMHDGASPAAVDRDTFVRRYDCVVDALLRPETLADRLAGMAAARRRRRAPGGAAAESVFVTQLAEVARGTGPWAPALAAALGTVHAMFRERFEGGAPAAPQWRREAPALLGAVFDAYDRNGDGLADRHDLKRLVLELLMEEKQAFTRLLDPLSQDLLVMVQEDAERPPPGFPLAIPMSFAHEEYAEAVQERAAEAAASAHAALDGMLKDYADIAERVWGRLDDERDGFVSRARFCERFGEVALPWRLVEPRNLADHLQGFEPRSDDEDEDGDEHTAGGREGEGGSAHA